MNREFPSFDYHLVELYNSQAKQNWGTLKYKFCEQNVWLIFLEDQCFEPFSKICFRTSFFPKGDYTYQILSSFPCTTNICFVLDFKTFRENVNLSFRKFTVEPFSFSNHFPFVGKPWWVFTLQHFSFLFAPWKMNKADSLTTYKVRLLSTCFPYHKRCTRFAYRIWFSVFWIFRVLVSNKIVEFVRAFFDNFAGFVICFIFVTKVLYLRLNTWYKSSS